MNAYVELVIAFPLLMAMLQFALLGTFGDAISHWFVQRAFSVPFNLSTALAKMIEWALLAICIKYAFLGFNGFIDILVAKGYLPELNVFTRALSISIAMNLQFGPFLVIAHRYLDNLIVKENNWSNMDKALKSLIWFWIPAHTVTFMLPKPYQIGLAALWSIVLAVILGVYKRQALTAQQAQGHAN